MLIDRFEIRGDLLGITGDWEKVTVKETKFAVTYSAHGSKVKFACMKNTFAFKKVTTGGGV